jgi:hypothetical protein
MQQPESLQSTLKIHWHNVSLGLRVVGSELKWLFLRILRNWEISQLRRRLEQEYALLGRTEAEAAGLDVSASPARTHIFDEKELALKQIAFLLDEIGFLSTQIQEERSAYIEHRVREWNVT